MKNLNSGLSIIIRDDFLFGTGRSDINPAGVSVLEKIGTTIGDFEGTVMVEGHTDNLPIRTKQFPSNWELSTSTCSQCCQIFYGNGERRAG